MFLILSLYALKWRTLSMQTLLYRYSTKKSSTKEQCFYAEQGGNVKGFSKKTPGGEAGRVGVVFRIRLAL